MPVQRVLLSSGAPGMCRNRVKAFQRLSRYSKAPPRRLLGAEALEVFVEPINALGDLLD